MAYKPSDLSTKSKPRFPRILSFTHSVADQIFKCSPVALSAKVNKTILTMYHKEQRERACVCVKENKTQILKDKRIKNSRCSLKLSEEWCSSVKNFPSKSKRAPWACQGLSNPSHTHPLYSGAYLLIWDPLTHELIMLTKTLRSSGNDSRPVCTCTFHLPTNPPAVKPTLTKAAMLKEQSSSHTALSGWLRPTHLAADPRAVSFCPKPGHAE